MDNIKVEIFEEFCSNAISIAIFSETPDGTCIAHVDNEYGFLNWDLIKQGEMIHKPTLSIDRRTSKSLLKALAEALSKEGIKTENDHKIQGILEAQSKHLEDMRDIVFKNYKPRIELAEVKVVIPKEKKE